MSNGLEAAMREALTRRLPDLDAGTIDYIIKTDLQNWTYREPFTAGYRAALAAREAEMGGLREELAIKDPVVKAALNWYVAGNLDQLMDVVAVYIDKAYPTNDALADHTP